MTKNSRVKGGTVPQVLRRKRALTMLTEQLKRGTKRNKENIIVPLTDKNIIRIKKEISILKTKL